MDFSQGNNFPIGNLSEVQLGRNGNQRHGTNYQTVWTSEDGMWNREASVDAIIGPNQAGMQLQSGNERQNKQFRNFSSENLTSSESAKVLARTFYKTRLCRKFQYSGTCSYGRCNFAHGLEELREPPPDWQETLAKYKEKYGPSEPDLEGRVSSAICLVSSGGYVNHRSNSLMNPSTWKTNICFKWNTSGNCSYGNNCHFAHGAAELRPRGALSVGENIYGHDSKLGEGSATTSVIVASAPGTSAHHSVGNHSVTPVTRLSNVMQGTGERIVRWKGPNKISKIYGDWIDDL